MSDELSRSIASAISRSVEMAVDQAISSIQSRKLTVTSNISAPSVATGAHSTALLMFVSFVMILVIIVQFRFLSFMSDFFYLLRLVIYEINGCQAIIVGSEKDEPCPHGPLSPHR